MDRHIPFPQADDFEKIITILNLSNESLLKNSDSLSSILGGISIRQVSYYLSAAMYLGLIVGIGNQKNILILEIHYETIILHFKEQS